MVANVRAAEQKAGRRIRILMDIGGPKVRTTHVTAPPDRDRLHIGDEILLSSDGNPPDALTFTTGCTLPQVFERLKVGDRISIDDGKLRGHIVRRTTAGFVARLEEGRDKGIKLKAEKGVEFPGR